MSHAPNNPQVPGVRAISEPAGPVGALALGTGSAVFLVFCEHNRYGEYLAGCYDNNAAAIAHKEYLDARIDGWENLCGGEIKRVEIAKTFDLPNR